MAAYYESSDRLQGEVVHSPIRLIKDWSRWARHSFRRQFFFASAYVTARRRRPVTLNEKIRYRMAFDRRPELVIFADKVAVRSLVWERVGPSVLTELFHVVTDSTELDLTTLPERCVIKPTHGSGSVIIVDPTAPIDARLVRPLSSGWHTVGIRVRKEHLDESVLRDVLNNWLTATYSPVSEWAYWDVPRRVVVEELLGADGPPCDYKFWCFDGQVGFIQTDLDRFSSHTRSIHRPDWSALAGSIAYPTPEIPPERPKNLTKMIEVAEQISDGVDFIRVDLYEFGDRIVFGELTNYPGAGGERMQPEDFFTAVADQWRPHLAYGPLASGRAG